MNRLKNIFVAGMLMMLPAVQGQEWIVPEDLAATSNPMDYTLENVKAG